MKNNFLKYASLFLFSAALLTSCEEDKVIFNGSSHDTMAAFNTDGAELGVPESGSAELLIQVDVTSKSDTERTIALSVDPSSTAVAEEYSIDAATLVIPADSYNGTIKLTGNFDALENGNKTLVLNLDSVEGASIDTQKTSFTVTLFRVCPVEATFLTGNYLLEEMTPYVDGPTLEDGTIRTISVDVNDPTKRIFTSYTYPQYCTTTRLPFRFSLVCGEIIIGSGNVSNCVCTQGQPFQFGPPTVNGTYDFEDDSVFYIAFTNDVTGNCAPASQTIYKLTKQ